MEMVLLTALGVGGATIFGSCVGFMFKKLSHKFSDIVLSFAAGVMLAAAVLGLILPSLEYGGKFGLLITITGVFVGAVCLNLIDKLVPHLHQFVGGDKEHQNSISQHASGGTFDHHSVTNLGTYEIICLRSDLAIGSHQGADRASTLLGCFVASLTGGNTLAFHGCSIMFNGNHRCFGFHTVPPIFESCRGAKRAINA